MKLSEFTEEDLKELAKQLSQPTGDIGVKVANTMNETNISMTLNAIGHLDVQKGMQVLEIGHGNCRHLPEVLNQAEAIRYFGLEISDLMYAEAQEINIQFIKQGKAEYHLYDGQTIPFESDTFQRIFSVNTIYFWQNPVAFFKEIYRVLKLEGKVCICFVHKESMKTLPFTKWGFEFYDQDKIKNLIDQTQFEIEAIPGFEEQVTSKVGEKVSRRFNTLILRKR
ncbi:class I SAM-dependent methyltransferase [bacterium SCSIO 12643]|nr:class I SAM-dependent methyltransferase [bacterium SCSIO 12643]